MSAPLPEKTPAGAAGSRRVPARARLLRKWLAIALLAAMIAMPLLLWLSNPGDEAKPDAAGSPAAALTGAPGLAQVAGDWRG